MNLLINFVLGILAFLIARYALGLVGLDEAIGWLVAVVVGIAVFFSNPAARLDR